ncbi:MAG: 50S ribosomal protein L25/general stress protein Ctc [Betaproteobacteria bacterium]|nr:50S ribosomal protein L25/general stress protein Ctc [Betaproteobacteria bacterium]
MNIEIKAEPRSLQGTGASRRLRRESKVPGILYGAGKDAQPIQLDHKELFFKLKLEAFHASILDMQIGSEKSQVLLRDYQMHPFKQMILHADFQRVAADRKIHMKVPLHFVNADVSPGVKLAGGSVQHVRNDIDIACLPKDLPMFIEVDLMDLQAGHSLHISGIKLPAGVESVALAKGDDMTIATILIPRVATADEEAVTAAAASAVSAADIPTSAQKVKEDEPAKDAGKAGGKDAGKAGGKDEKKK